MTYYVTDRFSLNHYILKADSETEALQKYFDYFCERNDDFVEELQEEDGVVFDLQYYVDNYNPQIEVIAENEVFEIITYS